MRFRSRPDLTGLRVRVRKLSSVASEMKEPPEYSLTRQQRAIRALHQRSVVSLVTATFLSRSRFMSSVSRDSGVFLFDRDNVDAAVSFVPPLWPAPVDHLDEVSSVSGSQRCVGHKTARFRW